MKALAATVCLWFAFLASTLADPGPVRIVEDQDGFQLFTARLAVEVRAGMIVSATNLLTGEVHASASADDPSGVPAGMGHLGGSPRTAALHHSPWGNRPLGSQASRATTFPSLHRPHAGSQYRAVRTETGISATWTGLTNGKEEFPDEQLTLLFEVDPADGVLQVRATASSPRGGIYGTQAPIANLHEDHRIYVSSLGGLFYDKRMSPRVVTLGQSPFWEAPVMAIEGRKGSLGLWIEDESLRSTFAFLTWTGKSFTTAIESLATMPFEPHQEVESAVWRIDAFDGGWVAAMTPYKQWYAGVFAKEMAQRAAVQWADKIRVIVDELEDNPDVWRRVASLIDPETVIVHEWNARAAGFDRDLPDWTPREGYVERVRALKALGFRTMAYVNTYCVNYNSPVFVCDRIAEFGLTRRIPNFWKYAEPRVTFDTFDEGQLLYLDPLSPQWRKYHTDMMIDWYKQTGTDANYEDVGGTTGDFGNGTIDGKTGAQGGVEQFRELLDRNGQVPMASEYAPDAIAFATRWPLRYQQVWGSESTRREWFERQRPVSAFLFGPHQRPWVPTVRAYDEFHRHLIVSCSDALGGLAQFRATSAELDSTGGISAQMRWRAVLFSKLQLVPDFVPTLEPANLACRYRDREGRQYAYYADDQVQQLVDEDGKALYARITGVTHYETDLSLPGWPARKGETIVGLDPAVRYALMPANGQQQSAVQVRDLPEGVKITRFYETPLASVLVLDRVSDSDPLEGAFKFTLDAGFRELLINGEPRPLADGQPTTSKTGETDLELKIALPAHLVFVRSQPQEVAEGDYLGDGKERGRYILVGTGLDRGGEYEVPHRANFAVPDETRSVPFLYLNKGVDSEVTIDWLIRVPDKSSVLRVYLQHRQNKFGDAVIARLYLNGKVRREEDLGPRPNPAWKEGMPDVEKSIWDKDFRAWTIPLGEWAGQTVLISVATDPKTGNNADEMWWSRPRIVADAEQKEVFQRLHQEQ